MWLPIECDEILGGIEQFAPDPAGETPLPGPAGEGDATWFVWGEVRDEAEWATYELGFLATGAA